MSAPFKYWFLNSFSIFLFEIVTRHESMNSNGTTCIFGSNINHNKTTSLPTLRYTADTDFELVFKVSNRSLLAKQTHSKTYSKQDPFPKWWSRFKPWMFVLCRFLVGKNFGNLLATGGKLCFVENKTYHRWKYHMPLSTRMGMHHPVAFNLFLMVASGWEWLTAVNGGLQTWYWDTKANNS